MERENLQALFDKWTDILRLKNSWDVKLELVEDPEFRKTGDFHVDCVTIGRRCCC